MPFTALTAAGVPPTIVHDVLAFINKVGSFAFKTQETVSPLAIGVLAGAQVPKSETGPGAAELDEDTGFGATDEEETGFGPGFAELDEEPGFGGVTAEEEEELPGTGPGTLELL
jgi:hypothetical protein